MKKNGKNILIVLLPVVLPIVILAVTQGQQKTPTAKAPGEQRIQANFDLPMRIAPVLSGNFGEIRTNHFHSGIDFKTEGRTGIPVYAVADGWLSRIRIGAYGFGYALYLDHPSGHTSVYAHLDRFAPRLDSLSKAFQYAVESFEIDTMLPSGTFSIKKGEVIAYSGNTGSSAGPHLHFEIRDSKSEDIIDPLFWYDTHIPDNKPPRIQQVVLFALNDKGVIQGGRKRHSVATKLSGNVWVLKDSFPAAYGTLGLGLKAYDYMDNTTNIYGVWQIRLYKNDSLLYARQMNQFAFADTRYVNAMIDYADFQKNNSIVMRTHRLPGDQWPNVMTFNNGLFTLSDGEKATFRYELSDRKGNKATLSFGLTGKALPLPKQQTGSQAGAVTGSLSVAETGSASTGQFMAWNRANVWESNNVRLELPKGTLYEDIRFTAARRKGSSHADIIRLHSTETPLHTAATLIIRLTNDTLRTKSQYFLAKQNKAGKWVNAGGWSYQNGSIRASIKDFGTYTVLTDATPPKITPVNSENAVKNRLFRIRIADDASGVASWKGTIDGKWVLFTFNANNGELRYAFDTTRLKGNNGNHVLELKVTDACGNTAVYTHSFYY